MSPGTPTLARRAPSADRVHGTIAAALGLVALPLLAWLPAGDDTGLRTAGLVVLALLVLVLGVPHGAADIFLLLTPASHRERWLRIALYVVAIQCVIVLWWLWPAATLTAFLIGSAVHFGEGDRRRVPIGGAPAALEIGLRGSLPILAPLVGHPTATGAALAALLPDHGPERVAEFLFLVRLPLALVLAVALGTLTVAGCRRSAHSPRLELAEIWTIAAIGLVAPPLLAFAFYFCIWHAPRHLIWLAEAERRPLASLLLPGLAVAVLSLAFVLPIAWWMPAAGDPADAGTRSTVLRLLFVGLAALTLPHALLVWRSARPPGSGRIAARQ